MVYKYPMDAYPYQDLVETNRARSRTEPEYELYDAMPDAFLQGHYWDVTFECQCCTLPVCTGVHL